MLPRLREELLIFAGGPAPNGEPTWILQDPSRNQFFRLDWLSYEILSRWSMNDIGAISAAVAAQTPLQAHELDVMQVGEFIMESELAAPGVIDAKTMMDRKTARETGWITWLLHNYLFMRFPLLRPDRWLDRLLPIYSVLFSRQFLLVTLGALVFGVWEVSSQWDTFRSSFVDHVSPSGLFSYGLVLVFVKIIHEFGHAFMAKRYGCRVPTMGIAFLVMWPVAYTDTTEAWKLQSRRQRLAISSAGVMAELVMAAWATAFWAVLPDGALRTACFLLSTTTWVSTLAINLNPLMRFDGYYIMSDALDVPNLQQRSFAMARWQLRKIIFNSREPPPDLLPPNTQRTVILLAWVIWIYRLGVYFGIALLVYHFFIKAIGILLFGVEVWWFLLGPIIREVRLWWKEREHLLITRRARIALLAPVAILLFLALPLPSNIGASGVLRPSLEQTLETPAAGQVSLLPKVGAQVAAGDLLVRMDSPKTLATQRAAEAQLQSAQADAAATAFNAAQRNQFSVAASQLSAAQTNLDSAQEGVDKLEVRAAFAGKVVDLEPDLAIGETIAKGARLGVLADDRNWSAVAYLSEDDIHRLRPGAEARFIRDGSMGDVVRLHVDQITHDATTTLPSGLWATVNGGSVVARLQNGAWVTDKPMFRVAFKADHPPTGADRRAVRGRVSISGQAHSVLFDAMRKLVAIVVKEAGF